MNDNYCIIGGHLHGDKLPVSPQVDIKAASTSKVGLEPTNGIPCHFGQLFGSFCRFAQCGQRPMQGVTLKAIF